MEKERGRKERRKKGKEEGRKNSKGEIMELNCIKFKPGLLVERPNAANFVALSKISFSFLLSPISFFSIKTRFLQLSPNESHSPMCFCSSSLIPVAMSWKRKSDYSNVSKGSVLSHFNQLMLSDRDSKTMAQALSLRSVCRVRGKYYLLVH